MARSVICTRPSGTSGASSASGFGVSRICLRATSTMSSASKGSLPESISYIMTPTE